MTPEKISQLPINSSPSLTDYIPELNSSGGVTERILLSDMANLFASQFLPSGMLTEYGGRAAPTGWLMCYGQAVSRTAYANLFNALVPSVGTFTVTIASPGVFTLSGHGFVTGDQVFLTTTGALPTGLSANTIYYVINVTTSTFKLATTMANAQAGTAINTSGTQSGTHTIYACPYGLGDGSSTFNVPDLRGRVPAGADAMGGTAASRLTAAQSQGVYGNQGQSGGEQSHTQTSTELAAHTHSGVTLAGGNPVGPTNGPSGSGKFSFSYTATTNFDGDLVSTSAGGGAAMNNVQPTLVTNFIIKT